MTIQNKLKQIFTPINQPTNFSRLYFLPEARALHIARPAGNDSVYRQIPAAPMPEPPETLLHKFVRQEKEILQETCADAWAALKQAGRDIVRFLARWIILPLTVASALWVPAGNPAALPL
jgi:hypothetical protein